MLQSDTDQNEQGVQPLIQRHRLSMCILYVHASIHTEGMKEAAKAREFLPKQNIRVKQVKAKVGKDNNSGNGDKRTKMNQTTNAQTDDWQ